jgi:hypothetical protein
MRRIEAKGMQQGRLLCLEERGKMVLCGCACGKEIEIWRTNFLAGYSQSCGCLRNERTSAANTTHGLSKTPTYGAWKTMRRRCEDPTHEKYKYYGSRGIRVCLRWQEFTNFLSDMGERPAGLELDRIDNNGNYEPDNCRWVTHKENCGNR